MSPPRPLGRFFLTALALYALFMAPWPGVAKGYAHLFRAGGNVLFARFWFWSDASVTFLDPQNLRPGDLPPGTPPIPTDKGKDTLLQLHRRAANTVGHLRTSSRPIGFGPTVVVVALILATPLHRRRKAWALAGGLLLVHAFIAFRITLLVTANGFAADKAYAIFQPGAFWRRVLGAMESLFADDPTVSFVVPALIWFVVSCAWSSGAEADATGSGSESVGPARPAGSRRS